MAYNNLPLTAEGNEYGFETFHPVQSVRFLILLLTDENGNFEENIYINKKSKRILRQTKSKMVLTQTKQQTCIDEKKMTNVF